MKQKFTLVLVGLLFAQSSFAGPKVLAEIKSSGGMMPGFFSGLQILDNGKVLSVNKRPDRNQTQVVAVLPTPIVEALAKRIESVKPGELVLDNPEAPQCTDTPYTAYLVNQSNGVQIQIASSSECRESHLKSGDGYEIQRVLDGLDALSFLD